MIVSEPRSVIREAEDNEIHYRIGKDETGRIYGEIFDQTTQQFLERPIVGLSEKILSLPLEKIRKIFEEQIQTIPFSHRIECRAMKEEDGRIAQFVLEKPLKTEEIEEIEKLPFDINLENKIDLSVGGIPFEKKNILFFPENPDHVSQIVQLATKYDRKIRAIGSMHSLNPICHTNDYLISLEKMNKVIEIRERSCTVEGGIVIRKLCEELEKSGLTLSTLGSICEQTIAGAVSTGTRGQVATQGSLASLITHLEYVDGTGTVRNLTKEENRDELNAVATSLGLMGIITKVTLTCTPLFLMSELIRLVPLQELIPQLEKLKTCEKLHMYWNVASDDVKVVTGHKVECNFPPAMLASFQTLGEYPHLHSMENFPNLIQRIGKSWDILTTLKWTKERIEKKAASMKRDNIGIFQGDYSVPENEFVPLLGEIQRFFREHQGMHLAKGRLVVEIRPVKADDVWLSPSYGRNSYSLCFHDFERPLEWSISASRDFREFENFLKKYSIRPHFGKAHFFNNRDLERAFPKWQSFKALRCLRDPEHVFLTDYLIQMFTNSERMF